MSNDLMTRTIYSICWPETAMGLKEMASVDISDRFTQTWSKKQDKMHVPYLNKWREVMQQFVVFDEQLKYSYPTNGSSESISNQIHHLNTQGKRLVVFEQEYEGYTMIAKNIGMPCLVIKRENFQQAIKDLNKQSDVFFISQPSSIDGCYWDEFPQFLAQMEKQEIDLYVDLAYAGFFSHQCIDLTNKKCVAGVFFSLSKLFGVYYHRIGGCFLRQENPLLWPMLWFKNLHSIEYAMMLLNKFEEKKYDSIRKDIKLYQERFAKIITDKYNVTVKCSDIALIIMIKYEPDNHPWMKEYLRSENPHYIRVCISAFIEQEVYKN